MNTNIEQGQILELGRDSGGRRHYLSGRPVHAGVVLELLTVNGWLRGRYEWTYRKNDPAIFCLMLQVPGTDQDGYPNRHQVEFLLPEYALLRWPVKREQGAIAHE